VTFRGRVRRRSEDKPGGGSCVGVSKAALKAAGAAVGDKVDLVIAPALS
jgi:hypothetical protein